MPPKFTQNERTELLTGRADSRNLVFLMNSTYLDKTVRYAVGHGDDGSVQLWLFDCCECGRRVSATIELTEAEAKRLAEQLTSPESP